MFFPFVFPWGKEHDFFSKFSLKFDVFSPYENVEYMIECHVGKEHKDLELVLEKDSCSFPTLIFIWGKNIKILK